MLQEVRQAVGWIGQRVTIDALFAETRSSIPQSIDEDARGQHYQAGTLRSLLQYLLRLRWAYQVTVGKTTHASNRQDCNLAASRYVECWRATQLARVVSVKHRGWPVSRRVVKMAIIVGITNLVGRDYSNVIDYLLRISFKLLGPR
jgi:hypothetical protein